MSQQPHADLVSTPGWVFVIVRDQRLQHLLLLALSLAGHAHLGCTTIAEAEQVLRERPPPRLILFDGAASSEEALRVQVQQLRALLVAEIRVHLLVFSETTPLPRIEYLAGVTALIARPFDLRQLLSQVEALF